MRNVFISKRQKVESKDISNIFGVEFSLYHKKFLALDFETSGLNPHSYLPLLATLRFDNEDVSYCFDLLCEQTRDDFYKLMVDVKKNNLLVCGHNIKFDLKVILSLFNNREMIELRLFDTMIFNQRQYRGSGYSSSLKNVLNYELGISVAKEERNSFVGITDKNHLFTEAQILYALGDIYHIKDLYDKQVKMVIDNKKSIEALKIEFNIIPIIAWLEFKGVGFDSEKWKETIITNKKIFDQIELNMDEELKQLGYIVPPRYVEVGSQLGMFGVDDTTSLILNEKATNYNSHSQISTIYRTFASSIPQNKYGDEGTGKDNIERFIRENQDDTLIPFSKLLLEHRKYSKRLSSFGEKFLEFSTITGRIHTDYKQSATTTGRFSSGDSKNGFPNMSQIPRSNDYRTAFLVDEGMIGMTIDLSQAELRILASESGDRNLIDLVMKGDTHSHLATAAMRALTGDRSFVVSKDVNGDLRTKFKNVIFGLAYGAGTSRIAELLNIGQYEAQIVYNAIYEEIPGAVDWLESKADEAIRTGRVVFNDVTGNYRLFPNYQDKSFENSIRREAKNCGIQGTNADMMKDGMIQVDRLLKKCESQGWIILQVYDELFIQYEESLENELKFSLMAQETLDETCNKYLKNGVKMVSEFSLGNSWIK